MRISKKILEEQVVEQQPNIPMREERRTGRTTKLLVNSLAELINTGQCTFKDHVEVSKDGLFQSKYIVQLFKDKLNGFIGRRVDQFYEFTYKGNNILEVKRKL